MGRGNNEVALLLLPGSPVVPKLGSSDPKPPENDDLAGFKQNFLHLFLHQEEEYTAFWSEVALSMLSCEVL